MSHRFEKAIGCLCSALAVLLVACCTENVPYRDLSSSHAPDSFGGYSGTAVQNVSFYPKSESQPYSLAFIEFDEKGDFWDRQQLGHAYKELTKLSANSNKPPLLLTYIHGWQNNSSDETHDVASFESLLKRLADNPQIKENYQVFGVYLGWRGLLVPSGDDPVSRTFLFVPHEFSLWSRKDAATRVAGEPMSEAISAMVHAARATNPHARTVLIGHSLGALILEKTLAQALPSSFYAQEDARGSNAKLLAPADLILLLSSAAESVYAKELMDMFRRAHFKGNISPTRPLILSVTSDGDWATGELFPLGTNLSNAFGVFRTYQRNKDFDGITETVDQNKYFTSTPGWNEDIICKRVRCLNPEELKLVANPNGSENGADPLDNGFNDNLSHPDSDSNFLKFRTEPQGHQIWWQIEPYGKNEKLSPYWVIRVPKEIIPDHSGIWLDSSIDMMAALYVIATDNQIKSEPRSATMTAPQ